MTRLLKLLWAMVRCHAYLWWNGLYFVQRSFQAYDVTGHIRLIAAVTGSMKDDTLVIHRTFWNEMDKGVTS